MTKRWQFVAMLGPLALVELASYWKLSHSLQWGSEAWLAFTTALAFVSLLLGAIVAMSLDIPEGMRRHIYLGGVWLFLVQGAANVLVVYQYGLTALPVEVMTRFFSIDAETARKATAIVQGGSLSVVSISFWSVLAQMLRADQEEQRQQQELLKRLDTLMKEGERNA